jgi:hypothetical protein
VKASTRLVSAFMASLKAIDLTFEFCLAAYRKFDVAVFEDDTGGFLWSLQNVRAYGKIFSQGASW